MSCCNATLRTSDYYRCGTDEPTRIDLSNYNLALRNVPNYLSQLRTTIQQPNGPDEPSRGRLNRQCETLPGLRTIKQRQPDQYTMTDSPSSPHDTWVKHEPDPMRPLRDTRRQDVRSLQLRGTRIPSDSGQLEVQTDFKSSAAAPPSGLRRHVVGRACTPVSVAAALR